VTDNNDLRPGTRHASRPPYRTIVWGVLRIVGSAAVLVTLYYLLPLSHSSLGSAITILVIGVAVFIALVAFQVRLIIRSPFPRLRGIEALATSVPLFLLLFASSYVVMAGMSASNFGERLTHTDGLYFTVTVFSTVGFGDITAKSQAARLVVTGQIIADFVILGLAIKAIIGAVSRRRQPADAGGAQPSQEIRR
jgi:Ion channel